MSITNIALPLYIVIITYFFNIFNSFAAIFYPPYKSCRPIFGTTAANQTTSALFSAEISASMEDVIISVSIPAPQHILPSGMEMPI